MDVWNKVTIVGVGLIGGSVGLALKKRGLANQIVGIDSDPSVLDAARERGAIDKGSTILLDGAQNAELVVICTPVDRIAAIARQAATAISRDGCLTDVGSTKRSIVESLSGQSDDSPAAVGIPFVGGHPMAGAEKSGVAFADADLFENRTTILTPTSSTAPAAIESVQQLWTGIGAKVHQMSAARHDQLIASISHLPHLIASALSASTAHDSLAFAASGWKDTTRISAGDAELWASILLDNRDCLLASLSDFSRTLDAFQSALKSNDRTTLVNQLLQGKTRRDAVGS